MPAMELQRLAGSASHLLSSLACLSSSESAAACARCSRQLAALTHEQLGPLRSLRQALNELDELLTAASARAADHGVDACADLSAASAAASVSLQDFEALAADLEAEAGEVVVGLARAADRLKANAASLRRPSRLARRAELLLAAMVRASAAGVSALPPPAGRPPELALTEAAKARLHSVREATQKLDDISGPLHGLSSAVRRVQAAAKPLSLDMLPWHRAVAAAASAAASVAESTGGLRAVVAALEGAGPGKKGKKKGPPPAQVEAAVRAARLDHLRSELGSFRRNTDALIRGKAVGDLPTALWPEGKAWPSSDLADEALSALRTALVAVGAEMPDGDAEQEAEEEEEAAEADAEQVPVLLTPADDSATDGATERLTAAALSLREAFTPSAARLTPATSALASALAAFVSAGAPRVQAVAEAAVQLRSPGQTGGPVGAMRAAAVGAEGVCAMLARSKHAEVKAACARVKKACVLSGKLAERLAEVVRLASDKTAAAATKLERGAARLQETLAAAQSAQVFAQRAAAALQQTMDEDMGQAVTARCDSTAAACASAAEAVATAAAATAVLDTSKLAAAFGHFTAATRAVEALSTALGSFHAATAPILSAPKPDHAGGKAAPIAPLLPGLTAAANAMDVCVGALGEAVGAVEEQFAAGKAITLKPLILASRMLGGLPKAAAVGEAAVALGEALPLLGVRLREEDLGAAEQNAGRGGGGGDGGDGGDGMEEASEAPTAAPAAEAATASTTEPETRVGRMGMGRKARPAKPPPPPPLSAPMPADKLTAAIVAALQLPREEAPAVAAVAAAGVSVIAEAYVAAAALRTPWSAHPRVRPATDGVPSLGQVWRLLSLLQLQRAAELHRLSALMGGPQAHAAPVAWEAFAVGLARIAHAHVAGPHGRRSSLFAPRLQRLLALLRRGLPLLDAARAVALPPHPTLAAFHRRRAPAWAYLLGLLSPDGVSVGREQTLSLLVHRDVLAPVVAARAAAAPGEQPSGEGSVGGARIAASRLTHHELLEEVARASAVACPELPLRLALRRQWGPFLARGAAALHTLAASISPAAPPAIDVALEALFTHHCSFGWHAGSAWLDASELRLEEPAFLRLAGCLCTDRAACRNVFQHHSAVAAGRRLLDLAGCREAMLLLAAREHLVHAPADTPPTDEGEDGADELPVQRARWAVADRLQAALDAALARLALGEGREGSRAWPTSRVRQLLVERLQSFALLFYAYSSPLDGGGGERGTSAEELAQLESDFRMHARLGCAQARTLQLHAACSGGTLSLLQLAQLLCDMDDTPAVRSAVGPDHLPRVLDVLALQRGGACLGGEPLRSRLLAFGRPLPEAPPSTDAREATELLHLPSELAVLAVPARELRRAVVALVAAHRPPAHGPAATAKAAEAFVGGSGTQTGCAFPLLLQEQLRPPAAPAAVHALLVESEAGPQSAGRAVPALLEARSLYAADLPADAPFPPRASVYFLCRLSMAAAAAGRPSSALQFALQATLAADAIGGEPDPLHACVACVVGTAAFRLRALSLAVAAFVRALAVRESGQAHALDLALVLNNLGAALECAAQPRLASQLYRRAHTMLSREVGLGHPRAAVLLRNLGSAAAGRASAAATVGRGSTTSTTELAMFRDGKGKGFLPPAYRA